MKLPIPVSFSPEAISEAIKTANSKGIPDDYRLRVAVKGGGGCGGAEPIIGFDKPTEHDEHYQIDDLDIIIDKRHVMFLIDYQVDFINTNEERGFVFNKG
ncbi:MAG: iron-sulfur cluster biosynthesis family protein [Cyclobacteriaceae bacterium]